MSYRTLAELESDIRYRYDLAGLEARHPQANLFRLINDAYRTLRDRLTSDGVQIYITSTEAAQSTTGRTSGYPGTLLTAATFGSFETVNEVHVLSGTVWYPLTRIHLADALTNTDGASIGFPESWTLAGVSAETGAVAGQQLQVLIVPSLDVARTFRVTGLKSWTDLTQTTDRLLTDMGAHEYIMASVGADVARRDEQTEQYALRVQEREQIYQDVRKRLLRRAPMAAQRIDVRRRGGARLWRP